MNRFWPEIDPSWMAHIGPEFDRPYMEGLEQFLKQEREEGCVVYPPASDMFNALNMTKFGDVRVVILGQDPYHGAGQAHGLSFSVPKGVRNPPSLQNIYKEIQAEYGMEMPKTGDLSGWARQGVLLLNATLTVRAESAGSHQKKGWEEFTDAIIRALSGQHEHIVFMLWGAYAQKKGVFIDRGKHLVLTSVHPSPLSAHRGFLGNGHFKKANEYLVEWGRETVNWRGVG